MNKINYVRKEIILFGAGEIGREAYWFLKQNATIKFYIDNNSSKWGTTLHEVEIISLEKYIAEKMSIPIVVTANDKNIEEIKKSLEKLNIENYSIFDNSKLLKKERIISYDLPHDMEDVILYHVLHDENNIFYVDVGSNDPELYNITKLFYDVKQAHGINIEPQRELIEITQKERPRDINICKGIGDKRDKKSFFIQGLQGGLSTFIENNIVDKNCIVEEIEITTLKDVFEEYIKSDIEIHFLKIDVEGYEENVLKGADFNKYRPWIVVVESVVSLQWVYTNEQWEYILEENQYHFTFSQGANRYYVADERSYLDSRFIGTDELKKLYDIYTLIKI